MKYSSGSVSQGLERGTTIYCGRYQRPQVSYIPISIHCQALKRGRPRFRRERPFLVGGGFGDTSTFGKAAESGSISPPPPKLAGRAIFFGRRRGQAPGGH